MRLTGILRHLEHVLSWFFRFRQRNIKAQKAGDVCIT